MPAIEKAMTGDFMKQTSSGGTSSCWSKHGQSAPSSDPHPSSCPSEDEDTRTMDRENLSFRKNHPLMKRSVQPVEDRPLYMATQARNIFTALDVETGITVNSGEQNITMFYIGTSDGYLLKVLPSSFDINGRYTSRHEPGTFAEKLYVYDANKCSDDEISTRDIQQNKRIVSVIAVKNRDLILIGFRNCVVAVPKYLCSNYTCKKDCIQSGKPYCGWKKGSCIPCVGKKGGIKRDVLSRANDLSNRTSENPTMSGPYLEENECSSTTLLALPIALSVSEAIVIVVLLIYILITWKDGKRRRKNAYLCQGKQHYEKGGDLHDVSAQRRIYIGPKKANIGSSSSSAFSCSRKGSFSGQQTDGDYPHGSASMDSLDGTFSLSSSLATDRRSDQPVHIVENMRMGAILPPNEQDPNLNNNNLKKSIGVAYGTPGIETPVKKSSSSSGKNDADSEGNIRMGFAWGSSAGGIQQRQPLCWKTNSLRSRTIISVSPMPITSNFPLMRSEPNQPNNVEEYTQATLAARSNGMLPQLPANGCNLPLKSPKVVSEYSEVENAENQTFRRRKSHDEPYYSEPAEPEYENLEFRRKLSGPENFTSTNLLSQPSTGDKNRPKFSSFTSSHFNTSWFPASALHETPTEMSPMMRVVTESSTSGVNSSSSSASVSDTQQTIYKKSIMTSTLGRRNNAHSMKARGERPYRRSADEGYGSEFFPRDDKRKPSNESSESSNHIYTNESQDTCTSPIFNGFVPDDNNVFKDLDAFGWRKDSKTKSLKRKKSSKRKKNADQRFVAPGVLSPSDNESVFAESLPRGPYFSTDACQIFHDSGYIRQGGRSLDDSFLEYSSTATDDPLGGFTENQYGFHTLRPNGRMRQKLPRLRHGPRETEATLKAVPTPEIPRI